MEDGDKKLFYYSDRESSDAKSFKKEQIIITVMWERDSIAQNSPGIVHIISVDKKDD
jgi:hypothetical protein